MNDICLHRTRGRIKDAVNFRRSTALQSSVITLANNIGSVVGDYVNRTARLKRQIEGLGWGSSAKGANHSYIFESLMSASILESGSVVVLEHRRDDSIQDVPVFQIKVNYNFACSWHNNAWRKVRRQQGITHWIIECVRKVCRRSRSGSDCNQIDRLVNFKLDFVIGTVGHRTGSEQKELACSVVKLSQVNGYTLGAFEKSNGLPAISL